GEVVTGEVEGEEVEAVARDEPAADRGGIRVYRAGAAAANRGRRSRPVRLEEAVEEEAPGTERGAVEAREGREVAVPAAVARDVHGGRDQGPVLQCLVDRDRGAREGG